MVLVSANPFTGELVYLWNRLLLRVDELVDIRLLAIIAFGALAMAGLAGAWGAKHRPPILGASIFTFTPTLTNHQGGTSSETVVAASSALGSLLLLSAPRPDDGSGDRGAAAVIVGLAAALLAGIEYTGLIAQAGWWCSTSSGCSGGVAVQLRRQKRDGVESVGARRCGTRGSSWRSAGIRTYSIGPNSPIGLSLSSCRQVRASCY
jgi:hypothetical protein